MTAEQYQIEIRHNALMELWKKRNPNEEISVFDLKVMECLVLLGEEYDKNYKCKDKEIKLYKLSKYLRKYLGIEIVTKDSKNNKSPENEKK